MVSLAAVMVLTYVAFVYFSESINPFTKPFIPSFRARWRYGRRMAIAVLVGGLTAVALVNFFSISFQHSVIVGLVFTTALAVYFSFSRIWRVVRS